MYVHNSEIPTLPLSTNIAEPPKNGVRMIDFLTEFDFSNNWVAHFHWVCEKLTAALVILTLSQTVGGLQILKAASIQSLIVYSPLRVILLASN